MSGFNESGDNRQVTEVGDSMSAQWQQHARDWRRVLCAVKRDHGRKEVLKNTLQKQTPQSRMAYSDALTMELLEIQPTRLLLNVTGSAMWTVCPSHGPPPIPTQSTISRITSLRILLNCYSCFCHSERSMCK